MDINTQGIRGEQLMLYVYTGDTSGNSKVIAFGTSVSINTEQETLSSSSKMSCRWASNLAGTVSYTVDSDSLYTQATGACSYDTLMAALIDGDAINWIVGQAQDESNVDCEARTYALDASKPHYAGKGIITSLSLTAGTDEMAQCSMTITGTGEIKALPS